MIHSRSLFNRSVHVGGPARGEPAAGPFQPLAPMLDALRGVAPARLSRFTAATWQPTTARLPVLDEPRREYSLHEAHAYCARLLSTAPTTRVGLGAATATAGVSADLPLASGQLPASLRPHVLAIYAFARAADDFADEPTYEGKRHFALDQWEHELFRTFHGEADHPIFVALRHTLTQFDLPIAPFTDLLTGFRMELGPASPATFEALRVYCRHSSEPLGQLVVRLFGCNDPARLRYAADLSTALQLTTFLQDVAHDLDHGRLYIPREDLLHFDIRDDQVAALRLGGRETSLPLAPPLAAAFRDLFRFQTARARSCFERGRPLIDRVSNDLAIELSLTFHSGLAMLDKIDALGEDLLRARPTLGPTERARVAARALGPRFPQLLARTSSAWWGRETP